MHKRLFITLLGFIILLAGCDYSINFMINDIQVHQNSIILHDSKITKSFLGVYRMS